MRSREDDRKEGTRLGKQRGIGERSEDEEKVEEE